MAADQPSHVDRIANRPQVATVSVPSSSLIATSIE